jgi:3-phosphoshikimate 1-carboxyvinyltransferase
VPPLALAAAAAQGTTVFENAERLRLKESDRIGERLRRYKQPRAEKPSVRGGALIVRGKGL